MPIVLNLGVDLDLGMILCLLVAHLILVPAIKGYPLQASIPKVAEKYNFRAFTFEGWRQGWLHQNIEPLYAALPRWQG